MLTNNNPKISYIDLLTNITIQGTGVKETYSLPIDYISSLETRNFALTWDTTGKTNGTYTITAKVLEDSMVLNETSTPFILGVIDTTPPSVTNPTAMPPSIVADGVKTSQLNVTVKDPGGIDTVTINLSAIGGSSETAMALIAEDIYSVITSASVGTPVGVYKLMINATSINGNSNTGEYVQLVVAPVIALKKGWNLISVPLNLTSWKLGNESAVGDPLNVTPENSLTSIYRYNTTSGLFEKCTHYADWGWAPATESESFTELEPGRGYWVWAENDCVWEHET